MSSDRYTAFRSVLVALCALTAYSCHYAAAIPSRVPRVGFVVIDAQKAFVASAVNPDMDQILARTAEVFRLASQYKEPIFVTYEDSMSGDNALPETLRRFLPRHHHRFIKTTFAATGSKSFAEALEQSGLTHLIVLGAETDVCVLQTSLGLSQLGFEVLLQKDAVFSSESNTLPALRRMEQAGVRLIGIDEVRKIIKGEMALPPPAPTGNSVIVPVREGCLDVALILNALDDEHELGSKDPYRRQKLERIREVLLLSEWMGIPTYVAGVDADTYTLPKSLLRMTPKAGQRLLARKTWRSLSTFPRRTFGQIFLAGVGEGIESIVKALGRGRQTFVIEDAMLDPPGAESQSLVPLTYKALYYGMIKSISADEWPLRSWIEREGPYKGLLRSPESLRPIRE